MVLGLCNHILDLSGQKFTVLGGIKMSCYWLMEGTFQSIMFVSDVNGCYNDEGQQLEMKIKNEIGPLTLSLHVFEK